MEKRKLGWAKKALLGITAAVMVGIGILGGVGTYSNLSHKYGGETALGALAAGEGATAVLALVMLVTTVFGRSAPRIVRLGLWALPAAAATMGATAAQGTGQTIVYALTPMAITAAAESVGYLARLAVVHVDGHDAEAEARSATLVRDLAYHQARAAAHPEKRTRTRSAKKAWRLAAKVGTGDATLGAALLDVQREKLTQGATVALERMFAPIASASAPALSAGSAQGTPALPPASAGDATTPGDHEPTIRPDSAEYPPHAAPDQAEETESVRPNLKVIQGEKKRTTSIAADVRDMVTAGIEDVRVIAEAIATRHGRDAEDPTFRSTVTRTFRAARADVASATATD
ncbi:conjugal transfer protein [Streptomyces sp. NPDC015144]|uniref:conjugal transfer protein n=1 Tax=Streptomyces sp. NPDC015144 TaxID=3364944 RepID=UPI0037008D87